MLIMLLIRYDNSFFKVSLPFKLPFVRYCAQDIWKNSSDIY